MPIVAGAIMPHPPIILSEIGGERLKEAGKTVAACQQVATALMAEDPEVVMVFTPHGRILRDRLSLYQSDKFAGDFSAFGRPELNFTFDSGSDLLKDHVESGLLKGVLEERLDHGLLVPLSFLVKEGFKGKVIPITIALRPLRELFEIGRKITKDLSARVAVIASADLSHSLKNSSPCGFNPRGKEFDEALKRLVDEHQVEKILDFDLDLSEDASEDALWSIALLLGAIEGLDFSHQLLSYEGPFGVGYLVAQYLKKKE